MDGNDHLKWLIGDLAFQLSFLKGRVEELESLIPKEAPKVEEVKENG